MSERSLLLVLALGNFVLGTGAFVLPALLQPLAADLGTSLAAAGWLMSGYALAYAFAAPLLTAVTGRWPRRRVLLTGLVLIAIGNGVLAAANGLAAAHLGRVVAALGGALYTPIAASIAIAVTAPERRGRALALVFAGITVAQVLGIPLGTLAASGLGWRAVFATVALAALAVAGVVRETLPADVAAPAATLGQLGTLLRDPGALLALGVTVAFFAGQFVVITFLGPVITSAAGVGSAGLSLLLWLFGVAAVVANLLAGAATDRFGPVPTLTFLTIASAAVLAGLPALEGQAWAAALLLVLWGLTGYGFMTPQQARLVALLPGAAGLALSLNASGLYVGSAIGGAVGGLLLERFGMPALGVGVVALLGASLVLLGASRRRPPTGRVTS